MSDTASHLPSAETSDAVLLSRIRAGETDAFGILYERHVGAARALARQLADGHEAVEDAVQETFAKILDVLRRGGGPRSGFRPYLLTAVRRTVYDRNRGERRLRPTDRMDLYDAGVPFVDPALEGLERSLIVRAFRSLPERWQVVLWHTEIEGARPAEVAPLLGLSANGVAALAYRAREGLRQAYLQMHLTGSSEHADTGTGFGAGLAAGAAAGADAAAGAGAAPIDERCRPVLEMLGAYVRRGLAKRDSRAVERHLDACERCRALHEEIADVNSRLREAVGPLVLGTASAAYLAARQGAGAAAGGSTAWWQMPRLLPGRQQPGLGAGVIAVAASVAVALVVVAGDRPLTLMHSPPSAVASPPETFPKAPGARRQPQRPPAGPSAPESHPPLRTPPAPPRPMPPALPTAQPATFAADLGTAAPPAWDETAISGTGALSGEGTPAAAPAPVTAAAPAPAPAPTADAGLPTDATSPDGVTVATATTVGAVPLAADGWASLPATTPSQATSAATSPSTSTDTGTVTGLEAGAEEDAGTDTGTVEVTAAVTSRSTTGTTTSPAAPAAERAGDGDRTRDTGIAVL